MSARHKSRNGTEHFFRMDLPISPYLIALAAGSLDFVPLAHVPEFMLKVRRSRRPLANLKTPNAWSTRWSDSMAHIAGDATICWFFHQVFLSAVWKIHASLSPLQP